VATRSGLVIKTGREVEVGRDGESKSVQRHTDYNTPHHVSFFEFGIVIASIGMIVVAVPTRFGDSNICVDCGVELFPADLLVAVKILSFVAGNVVQAFNLNRRFGFVPVPLPCETFVLEVESCAFRLPSIHLALQKHLAL